MAKSKIEEVVEAIKDLTASELVKLQQLLSETFNISAADLSSGGGEKKEEVKKLLSVVIFALPDVGLKTTAIKALRGLLSTKPLADVIKDIDAVIGGKEVVVKQGIQEAEANQIKTTLEAAGLSIKLIAE